MKRLYYTYKLKHMQKQVEKLKKSGQIYAAYELSLKCFDLSHRILNNY